MVGAERKAGDDGRLRDVLALLRWALIYLHSDTKVRLNGGSGIAINFSLMIQSIFYIQRR